ncbi:Hypothetical predicted protein [Mytilus galloprovincialis]|uniref:Uncharacterized protein n=1 Tax=Mytilus galloprovincialis TaxID=29158 RepID=A0A8B6EYG1_MYTGA|nr:Hypothetical predicted protein [Mytilus galloprovincialis]
MDNDPKHPLKVHVWAGISKRCATPILIFDGIINGQFFTDHILRDTFLLYVRRNFRTNIASKWTTTQNILLRFMCGLVSAKDDALHQFYYSTVLFYKWTVLYRPHTEGHLPAVIVLQTEFSGPTSLPNGQRPKTQQDSLERLLTTQSQATPGLLAVASDDDTDEENTIPADSW